jgi:hypothetical protein
MIEFILFIIAVLIMPFSIFVIPFKIISYALADTNLLRNYFLKLAISIDQFGASTLDWNEDETISSQIGRMKKDGTIKEPWTSLCKILNKLEVNHCLKNIGE